MAIESFKYGNPEDILDRIRSDAEKEKRRAERERKRKAKRIAALTKKAIRGELHGR